MKGTLYVIATPLGNLSDITYRAIEVLKSVDAIACEDSRRTRILMDHYAIQKPLLPLYAPHEERQSRRILDLINAGQSVALLSDAGTPNVSDPGSSLVRRAYAEEVSVIPLPGPCAVSSAYSVYPSVGRGFVFLGFLPRSAGRIRREFKNFLNHDLPIIFYESPYRVIKTLEIAQEVFGSRSECLVAREMTKKFEEYLFGPLEVVLEKLQNRKLLGEFTIILQPAVSLLERGEEQENDQERKNIEN